MESSSPSEAMDLLLATADNRLNHYLHFVVTPTIVLITALNLMFATDAASLRRSGKAETSNIRRARWNR